MEDPDHIEELVDEVGARLNVHQPIHRNEVLLAHIDHHFLLHCVKLDDIEVLVELFLDHTPTFALLGHVEFWRDQGNEAMEIVVEDLVELFLGADFEMLRKSHHFFEFERLEIVGEGRKLGGDESPHFGVDGVGRGQVDLELSAVFVQKGRPEEPQEKEQEN